MWSDRSSRQPLNSLFGCLQVLCDHHDVPMSLTLDELQSLLARRQGLAGARIALLKAGFVTGRMQLTTEALRRPAQSFPVLAERREGGYVLIIGVSAGNGEELIGVFDPEDGEARARPWSPELVAKVLAGEALRAAPARASRPSRGLEAAPARAARPSRDPEAAPARAARPSRDPEAAPARAARPSRALESVPAHAARPVRALEAVPAHAARPVRGLEAAVVKPRNPNVRAPKRKDIMTDFYADAFENILVHGGTVRIDLGTYSPSDKTDDDQPVLELTGRLVMPLEGFVKAYGGISEVVRQMVEAGVIEPVRDSDGPVGHA